MNDDFQDFVNTFLNSIHSVAPFRTLKVKSNTKPWFDVDVLYTIPDSKYVQKFQVIRQRN